MATHTSSQPSGPPPSTTSAIFGSSGLPALRADVERVAAELERVGLELAELRGRLAALEHQLRNAQQTTSHVLDALDRYDLEAAAAARKDPPP